MATVLPLAARLTMCDVVSSSRADVAEKASLLIPSFFQSSTLKE